MRLQRLFLGIAVFAALAAVDSASAVCSNADLVGVWGYQVGSSVGQLSADGNGALTGSQTESDNGTIVTVTYSGTYSIAKNCTGKFKLNITGGGTSTGNLVVYNGKKRMQIMITDPGKVASGFAAAQGISSCGFTGKKETFAANLSGMIPGIGSAAGVGQIILDGGGNISGSITWSVAGAITTSPITGTYSENADCTGTATITPSGSSASHYNLAVVNARSEVLLIETDANTVVTGSMQK